MTDEDRGDAMRRLRTRSVQAGHPDGDGVWPVVAPIVTSTAYASRDPEAMSRRMRNGEPTYGRDHFPNLRQLEELVAELEGAEAGYATASGMAAISLVALALLSCGDHVVLGAGGYCDTVELFTRELPRFGIDCTVVNLCDVDAMRAAMRAETAMILTETIGNPSMAIADIPVLSGIARERGIPLVIDNTLPTPVLCRPLEHGADLVVHSVTKFLGGHHDLSAGVVVGDARLMERIRRVGYLLGGVPGAHDAALAVRGIRTLVPRMAWISRGASEIARYLEDRPEIASVRYPGLASGGDSGLAARLLPDGGGGVLVAEFAGPDAPAVAADFVRSLRLIPYAASLGGEITTLCYPPCLLTEDERRNRQGGPALRFSIGLEDPRDLIADMEQAFEQVKDGAIS